MQFNSMSFMVFFPIVLAVYFVIPRRIRYIWLLVASYYFYMSWNAKYAFLIAGSTVITYLGARLLSYFDKDDRSATRTRKAVLIVCTVLNLSFLVVFKYANFGIDTFNMICSVLNVAPVSRHLDLLLPVGISFYTFQATGYLVDVYRKDIPAEKNILRYALFVSFFPQLVAGPIERSRKLIPQLNDIENVNLWNAKRITSGAILIVWGLFLKMVIADRVAVLVNTVFDQYRMCGSTELIAGAIGFSLQIYCDFNSYSTIAVGTSKIMGVDLMNNFDTPYFSVSVRDFWRRWHISLSSWFRDYLYIPLGGNRKGKLRQYVNTLIVFLVSGLWHGANWTFVVWGGLHGLYLVAGDITRSWRAKAVQKLGIRTECFSFRLTKCVITYVFVVIAWVFFRAASVTDAFRYLYRIVIKPDPWLLFNGGLFGIGLDRVEMNILILSLLILVIVGFIRYRTGQAIDGILMSQNVWFEWGVIISLIYMIIVFGQYGSAFDPQQFLYFQF